MIVALVLIPAMLLLFRARLRRRARVVSVAPALQVMTWDDSGRPRRSPFGDDERGM